MNTHVNPCNATLKTQLKLMTLTQTRVFTRRQTARFVQHIPTKLLILKHVSGISCICIVQHNFVNVVVALIHCSVQSVKS